MQVSQLQRPARDLPFMGHIPGLTLVALFAAAAYGLRSLPGLGTFSPMIIGILVGMLFANIFALPETAVTGVKFAAKTLLRAAVALLGLQITLSQIGALGVGGFAVAAIALFSTYFFTLWVGRRMGIGRELTGLIAAGSSICGASAIAAADLTIRGKDEDVAYAVSCVTIFGTLAMFAFPLLMPVFGLSPAQYGVWSGAAVHEVAQVVGAGFQGGEEAGTIAIVVKLCRVVMLAPLLILMGLMINRKGGGDKSTARPPLVPFFLIAFVAIMLVNSLGVIPAPAHDGLVTITPILLTMALTALGMNTNFAKLKSLGLRPLVLGGLATIWISAVSLGAAVFFF
ncbi:YeiH family protein [Paracoccus aminophilus]|uniref:Uncharacterized protein n=1 Tax=Paracoccus aminophilus JCM 7686 TaxID=1367847 RepID=S5XUU3_PARAH|nr:YeiH family protein [Paracoccus aminophilus]AGT11279.1 hypothetical protein JCM7686_pAMI5p213 [Paracoccus aminophilus JCM 7686]